MSWGRSLAALTLILLTGVLARDARARSPQAHADLASLPLQVAAWTGREGEPLDPDTVRMLGADQYLERSYTTAADAPVDLYIAYYNRQQPGATIHSPLHCLPGTGWEPLGIATVSLTQPDGRVGQVRRLLVRKNMDRALVLYWYAIHGRMIASETLSKVWLLHDSLRFRRSDAALVRVVVPVSGSGIDVAQREALAFAHDVLPYLPHLWS